MMKTTLLVVACVGFLALAGCNRCGMWDWYKECDLIEGRVTRDCGPCGPNYQPGQVVRTEYAVPVGDPKPCAAPGAEAAPPPPTNVAPLAPPAELTPAPPVPMPE